MRALTSTLMVATLSAGLTACGGATWMDVGVGTGGGGVAVGTSVTGTTAASAGAATTESVVTENQLRAEWTSQTLGDRTRVTGYVHNGWVMWARDIMLLVDSFDAAGQVVRRTQTRLWRLVGPGSSSYFDVTLPTAASYRVQVVGVRWVTDEELGGAW
jgi:hypothetical protein